MSNNRLRRLFVIDPAIKDFHLLAKLGSEGIMPQAEVLVLEPDKKEIEQITRVVRKHVDFSDIHIISQGSPGCLYLGNSRLSVYNFNYYASQLKNWTVNNIFLYGCNIGAEEIGKKFILRLYKATGANISTLVSTQRMHTKVGIGIWTKSQYTLIKPQFAAQTA